MDDQAGFSLLEVLIAMLILSTGILGFANATLMALRGHQSSYFQSLAVIQLESMAERLRSCQHENTIFTNCLSQEITGWQKANIVLFPRVRSTVSGQGLNYQLKISWRMQSNLSTMSSLEEKVSL